MRVHARAVQAITAIVLFLGAAGVLAAGPDGNIGGSKTVDGVTIYLGVTPAAMLREEYAKQSPEREMHGGIPPGAHEHHVMIALFDASGGKRITDADVEATVHEVGLSGATKKLLPMTIAGMTTYGNFFAMPNDTIYRIELAIRRPGVDGVVHAEFDYEHIDR